jgi:hypothetical protein
MVVGGEVVICVLPLLPSVVRSRGHRRWRLIAVATAAVVVLVALYPGGDAEPGEAEHGVVGFDGLRPSSLVGGLVVTGLKGSPLEQELLALAAGRRHRLHVRRLLRLRHVEQVSTAAWVGYAPRHHASLALLGPHGAAAERVAGEERLLRGAVAAVRPVVLLLRMVVLERHERVGERLQREAELLAVAAGARQQVGRVGLEAPHGRGLRPGRGRRRLAAASCRAAHGEEGLDGVGDGVRVERRREEATRCRAGGSSSRRAAGEVERPGVRDGDGLRLVVGVLGGVGRVRGGRRRRIAGGGLPRG